MTFSFKQNAFLGFLIFATMLVNFSYANIISVEDSLRVVNLCSSAEENISDHENSIEYLSIAKKIATENNCYSCIGEVYSTLAYLKQKHNQVDSALFYYNKAFEMYNADSVYSKSLEVIHKISQLHFDQYDFAKAIEYVKKSFLVGDSLEFTNIRADLFLIMGSSYDELGLYRKSAEALIKALEIFEIRNDSAGICSSLINLGTVFSSNENYDDAYEYTSRAMEIATLLDDKYSISACLNNIGSNYSYTGDFEKSLDYFSRSLEMDRKLGDQYGIAICLNNIGDTYKDLGDTVLAMSYYMKGLDVGRSNNMVIVAVILTNLAELYLSQGRLKEALINANEGLGVAQDASSMDDILSSYEILHKIYSEMGRYENAYEYLLKKERLRDSTYTLSKTQYIQEVKAKYNDEKQKTEISSLKEQSVGETVTRRYLIITILAVSILIISMFIVNNIILRSRKQVRKQKLYYEKLLENSEDYVTVVDESAVIKYVSPSYERRLGRPASTRIGKSIFDFIHPDDQESIRKEFKKLLNDKRSRNTTFRLIDAYGQWLTVYAYGQNLLNDPTIDGIVINFWDITQLKLNEDLIAKSEIKFREIFNAFPDIYFQTDVKGIITEISPSVEGLIEYTREELMGISPIEYNHFIADWKKIAARVESNGRISDHDTQVKTKSGKIIDCSFSAEYIYDENKIRSGIKGVIRDISSRIKNQKKLSESQAKLREANKAKEMIFSIIAHDLIGPIGTNKSIVDLIVNQVDELSQDEIISLITSLKPSLDSTYSMIENLLSWSRIQQNRILPNFENVLLMDVLKHIGSILASQAERKSVDLEIIGDEEIKVYGDQNQLDIILRNLISNAIKFSNIDDKVSVKVKENKSDVEIRVIDTGIGMTAKEISRVLSGKGVSNSRKGTNNEKGTGFGLVIVSEFIKNNKGTLRIESEEGKGTTFIINLPLGT